MGDTSLFQDIGEYIRLSKDAISLAKAGWSLLPKSDKRDEAERALTAADNALKRTDAALASKLGYNLCQCTYPPQIMLWRESIKQTVCPNPECGRAIKSFDHELERSDRSGTEYF